MRYRAISALSIAVFISILGLACSERERLTDSSLDPDPTTGGPHDSPGAVSDSVTAALGAVLETPSGIRAVIEAGDLPKDVVISMIPVDFDDTDQRQIAGVRFEPAGLLLEHPIVVSFPLPADWADDVEPLVFEFAGDDPSEGFQTYNHARVVGSPGSYRAEVLVSHFSGVVCASNCHAGTIRFVLEKFAEQGCSNEDALQMVREQYPNVPIPDNGCGGRDVPVVQAFLDTFFDDFAGYDPGESISQSVLNSVIQIAESGRQVVFAYNPSPWEPRSGPENFYPTSAVSFAHTTALEKKDGVWQLRNSLATGHEQLIGVLDGNTVWYPATDVNTFRELPQGVATEMQVCGSPDCLSAPSLNSYGLNVYNPIAGIHFWDQPFSNAWESFLQGGQWRGQPPRTIPWKAIRIYVQKPGLTPNPCDEEAAVVVAPVLPGYDGPFVVGIVRSGYGVRNDVGGQPALSVSADPDAHPYYTETFAMLFDKTIPGPGTYDLAAESPFVTVSLLTWQIATDASEPASFHEESGTAVLESFGVTKGSRIAGTVSANLVGSVPGQDGDVRGLVTASFDFILGSDFP